jgi:hypothetical protein
MKYISIGVSCRVSYSAIDCLQEPHGGIGMFYESEAVIAILIFCLRINSRKIATRSAQRPEGYAAFS